MKCSLWSYSLVFLRLFYAAIFLFAGFTKAFAFKSTVNTISRFQIIPNQFLFLFATLLIVIEITIGILIVFQIKPNLVITSSLILLTIFSIATIIGIIEGKKIDCGCFGTILSSQIGYTLILRNIGFVFIGSMLIYFERGEGKNE